MSEDKKTENQPDAGVAYEATQTICEGALDKTIIGANPFAAPTKIVEEQKTNNIVPLEKLLDTHKKERKSILGKLKSVFGK